MSEITYLSCRTEYDVKEDYYTIIDYSCISGIRELFISGKGHLNYQKIKRIDTFAVRNKVFKRNRKFKVFTKAGFVV